MIAGPATMSDFSSPTNALSPTSLMEMSTDVVGQEAANRSLARGSVSKARSMAIPRKARDNASVAIAYDRSQTLLECCMLGEISLDEMLALPLDWQSLATERMLARRRSDQGLAPIPSTSPLDTARRRSATTTPTLSSSFASYTTAPTMGGAAALPPATSSSSYSTSSSSAPIMASGPSPVGFASRHAIPMIGPSNFHCDSASMSNFTYGSMQTNMNMAFMNGGMAPSNPWKAQFPKSFPQSIVAASSTPEYQGGGSSNLISSARRTSLGNGRRTISTANSPLSSDFLHAQPVSLAQIPSGANQPQTTPSLLGASAESSPETSIISPLWPSTPLSDEAHRTMKGKLEHPLHSQNWQAGPLTPTIQTTTSAPSTTAASFGTHVQNSRLPLLSPEVPYSLHGTNMDDHAASSPFDEAFFVRSPGQ